MRINLFFLFLVIGSNTRHSRRKNRKRTRKRPNETRLKPRNALPFIEPVLTVVDSFSNFGSMVNSCVQTAYMVKEYEINKRQLAISEQELKNNRLLAKIAKNTLDWEKEKFRIEQILDKEDTKATAELQKQLNANMVDAMGRLTKFIEDLVDVTRNQDLWPMYREIKSKTYRLMFVAETDAAIKVRNERVNITRKKLRKEIKNGDFDFKKFEHVVNHVVEKMTRDCDYEAISLLAFQINLMFNLLNSIFKNDESLFNAKRVEALYLESDQKFFLEKSIMFHLKKNWLINEPTFDGSTLCFQPYYKDTNTSSVCYDCKYLNLKTKLQSTTSRPLETRKNNFAAY